MMTTKLVVALMLTAITCNASAEWVKIGNTNEFTIFMDKAKSIKTGNKVMIWSLKDFNEPQEEADKTQLWFSYVEHEEYDCEKKKYRAVYMANYSEKMQGGKITWSYSKPVERIPIRLVV